MIHMIDKIALGIAIFGAVLGAGLGTRLQQYDRNLPAIFAVASGVIFYLAAYVLLTIAVVVAASYLLFFLTWRLWPAIREAANTWANAAGTRHARRRRSFGRRARELHNEFEKRREELRRLIGDTENLEELLEHQEMLFYERLRGLGDD